MRRTGLVAALSLTLVFLSGIAVGAFGYRWYAGPAVRAAGPPPPEEFRRQYIAEMQNRLKLSADQAQQLGGILDATREQYHAFRVQHKADLQAIQDDQVKRISAILSAEQRQAYDRLRLERDRRRREGKK